MKKITIILILLSWVIFLTAGTATAATTGIDSGSSLLAPASADGILDRLYGLNNLQRVDDFGVLPNDQIWFNPDTGAAQAQAKFAGYAHDFGYIPDTDGNGTFDETVVPLFSLGPDINTILTAGPSGTLTGGPVDFVWTLRTSGGQTWTSIPNPVQDGLDHMVTWLIFNNAGDGHENNPVGNYVIAWEDVYGGGDKDYSDLVVEVSGVNAVPIPGSILLLGSGLVGLIGFARRKKS